MAGKLNNISNQPYSVHQVLIGSWNVAQQKRIKVDYSKWLGPSLNHDKIELYIFSFQEVLRVDNVAANPPPIDSGCFTFWSISLLEYINSIRSTSQVSILWEGYLGGTLFVAYIRKDLVPHVKDLHHMNVEVGRSRTTIKGGVCLRFKLGKTFSFASVHLTADQDGNKNFEQRVKDFHTIVNSTYTNGHRFDGHDFVCWVGDFNFRVDLPRDQIVQLITEKNWNGILEYDQLLRAKADGIAFKGYSEGAINFPPSYKYKLGTDEFDLSEPLAKQIPAYTDRVVWKKQDHIRAHLQTYTLGHLSEADHKPVIAVFTFS